MNNKKGKAEKWKQRGYWTRVANPKVSLAGIDSVFGNIDRHYFDRGGTELREGDIVQMCDGDCSPIGGTFHIHERFYHAYIKLEGIPNLFKCPPDVWLENVVKIKDR